MIGVFDYTVILTYLSLLSASIGIGFSLMGSGGGCPYYGIFCLLFCGLCDAFDGKVAHTKVNRSSFEKRFGIQIDSLSDLVAFGVLPACIGVAMFRTSSYLNTTLFVKGTYLSFVLKCLLFAILFFYVLAALIRLAYFNVTEEERQNKESGVRKTYTGLPVTSAAIVFPSILLLQYITPFDITLVYFVALLGMEIAFLLKFKLKKLDTKGILCLVLVGAVEFLLLILVKFMR